MKGFLCVTAIWAALLVVTASPAESQDDYTFIATNRGNQVCVGTWIPPREAGLPGTCEGQIMTYAQFSAVSGRQSVDRLDQLLVSLESINEKMAINNDQIGKLVDATVNTQNSIERQVRQSGDFLRETIARRFEALPKELLSNESFKEALSKLKEDILAEVDKRFPARQAPPAK